MSSQPQQRQQPRGLPGFLRRTLRTSYDDMIDVADSGTIVLPRFETARDEYGIEPEKGDVCSSDGAIEKGSELVDGDDKGDISGTGTGRDDAGMLGASASGNKHLRIVAFPPLPSERGVDKHCDSSLRIADSNRNEEDTLVLVQSTSALAVSTPSQRTSSPTHRSTNTNTNTPQSPPKSYRETQFETVITSPIIPLRDLRKLSWNGIPPQHRSLSWKILLGYLPANASRHGSTLHRKRAEYREAKKQHYDIPDDTRTNSEQETLRQVLVDVPRTAPEVPLFHNDRIRRCLTRLLYIWAMRHPASSYVQGINDLATPFLAVFLSGYFRGTPCLDGEIMECVTEELLEEAEADTYWCLTNLLAGIQDHYTSDQPGMQRMVMRLEELVNRIDVDLSFHLKETGIEFMQFAFKWMNCLLLREFSLSCVIRLWDTYLSEGGGGFEDFHVYVCASFLVHFSNELQQMGFDELFQFMQNIPTQEWGDREIEMLLSSAFVLSTLFGGSEAHLNVVRADHLRSA